MKAVGIDNVVLLALFIRIWSIGAGIVSIYFVTSHLTPISQGFYYTFYSISSLAMLAEMGLNTTTIQFVSHEMAHLEWNENHTELKGVESIKKRLGAISSISLKWIFYSSIVLMLLLLIIGAYYFSDQTSQNVLNGNYVAWCLLAVSTPVTLTINTVLAIIEGAGEVYKSYLIRFVQSIVVSIALWLCLVCEIELYSIGVAAFSGAIVALLLIFAKYWKMLIVLLKLGKSGVLNYTWRENLWPVQSKIALGWVSTFVLSQMMPPLLFKAAGPVAAGQAGLTLQILSAMSSSAMVWVNTKASTFGGLVASGQFSRLKKTFELAVFHSIFFLLIMIAAFLSVYFYLNSINSTIIYRIVPMSVLLLLLVATIGSHIVLSVTFFIRSFMIDPVSIYSLLAAIFMVASSILFLSSYGLDGVIGSYTVSIFVFMLPPSLFYYSKICNEYC